MERLRMRWAKWFVGIAMALPVALGVALYGTLWASLPELDGEVSIVGLSAPVRVDRDAAGVPTLTGTTRLDVARALGFATSNAGPGSRLSGNRQCVQKSVIWSKGSTRL